MQFSTSAGRDGSSDEDEDEDEDARRHRLRRRRALLAEIGAAVFGMYDAAVVIGAVMTPASGGGGGGSNARRGGGRTAGGGASSERGGGGLSSSVGAGDAIGASAAALKRRIASGKALDRDQIADMCAALLPPTLPAGVLLLNKNKLTNTRTCVRIPRSDSWNEKPTVESSFAPLRVILSLRFGPSWDRTLVFVDLSENHLDMVPTELTDIVALAHVRLHANRIATLASIEEFALTTAPQHSQRFGDHHRHPRGGFGAQLASVSFFGNPVEESMGRAAYHGAMRRLFPSATRIDLTLVTAADRRDDLERPPSAAGAGSAARASASPARRPGSSAGRNRAAPTPLGQRLSSSGAAKRQ